MTEAKLEIVSLKENEGSQLAKQYDEPKNIENPNDNKESEDGYTESDTVTLSPKRSPLKRSITPLTEKKKSSFAAERKIAEKKNQAKMRITYVVTKEICEENGIDLSREKYRLFKRTFTVFDQDGDGSVTADELLSFLNWGENKAVDMKKLMFKIYKKHTLSFEEFIVLLDKHLPKFEDILNGTRPLKDLTFDVNRKKRRRSRKPKLGNNDRGNRHGMVMGTTDIDFIKWWKQTEKKKEKKKKKKKQHRKVMKRLLKPFSPTSEESMPALEQPQRSKSIPRYSVPSKVRAAERARSQHLQRTNFQYMDHHHNDPMASASAHLYNSNQSRATQFRKEHKAFRGFDDDESPRDIAIEPLTPAKESDEQHIVKPQPLYVRARPIQSSQGSRSAKPRTRRRVHSNASMLVRRPNTKPLTTTKKPMTKKKNPYATTSLHKTQVIDKPPSLPKRHIQSSQGRRPNGHQPSRRPNTRGTARRPHVRGRRPNTRGPARRPVQKESTIPPLVKPMNQDAAFPPNPANEDDIIRTDTHYEEEEKVLTPRQSKSPKQQRMSRKHKQLARIYASGGAIPEYKKTPPRIEAYRQGFVTSPPKAISPQWKSVPERKKNSIQLAEKDETIPETARSSNSEVQHQEHQGVPFTTM